MAPCYDPPEPRRRNVKKSLKAKISRLESLLCSACRVHERLGVDFGENPLLDEWWAKHKKQDEKKAFKNKGEKNGKRK